MPVIVDTFNVLHTTGVLPPELAGVGLEGLAALIRSSRYAREQVTLICDGFGTENALDETHFLRVTFAGLGRTADDLIAELVSGSAAPRQLVVVSSDNQVLRAAKRRGSRRLTAEQFLQHLADDAHSFPRTGRPSAKPMAPASEDEVARWINDFELSEDEMSHPAAASAPVARGPADSLARKNTEELRDGAEHRQPADGSNPTDGRALDQANQPQAGSHASPPASPRASDLPQLLFGDLPEDLIREAESLWNRNAPPRDGP